MKKQLVGILCAAAVGLVAPAYAGESSQHDPLVVGADAVLGRPLCLAATVVGSVIFVASLPFSALSGSIGSAADALVMTPARATFRRPLGDFDYEIEPPADTTRGTVLPPKAPLHHRYAKVRRQ